MKKKFSLWLNLATICLCVCAIAIGVYAATSASLTVSGQIGFTAHGVDMDVTVYMYGHATSEDGDPILEEDKVSLIGTNAESEEDDTRPLEEKDTIKFTQDNSAIYFSDMTSTDANGKPEDIYVVVTLKPGEDLKFDVMATASGTSADDSVLITPNAENTLIGYDDTEAKTITFKLSVKPNAQGGYDEIADTNNVSLNIELKKVSEKENVTVNAFGDEAATIRENIVGALMSEFGEDAADYLGSLSSQHKSYAERFPYYINFGKQGTTDLRWLVVGVDEGNDVLSTLTEADKRALAAGYMIKGRNYYLLSENMLDVDYDANIKGLSYQNNYKRDDSNTLTQYPNSQGVNANDYATSNIRAYLKGETVKPSYTKSSDVYSPSGEDVNFFTTYSFTDAEKALIKPRKVTDLYKDESMSVEFGILSDMTNYENVEDDFWILSDTESDTLFAVDDIDTDAGYDFIFLSAVATLQSDQSNIVNGWWFRSPADYDIENSEPVVYEQNAVHLSYLWGDWDCGYPVYYATGVRPAFKI